MSIIARLRNLSSAFLLIPLVTVIVGCANSGSSDLEERVKLLEMSQAETAAQLRKVTVELESLNKGMLVAALQVIDSAGLHEMDEDLQKATEINPRYLGTIRKVKRVVIGTAWPTPLKDKVEAFKITLIEIETALTDNDLTASREATRKLHLTYHPLVDAWWKIVAGQPTD